MTLLCKDCIHCKPANGIVFWLTRSRWEFARCGLDSSTVKPSFYCETEREFTCGPEAKYFEPKRKR